MAHKRTTAFLQIKHANVFLLINILIFTPFSDPAYFAH